MASDHVNRTLPNPYFIPRRLACPEQSTRRKKTVNLKFTHRDPIKFASKLQSGSVPRRPEYPSFSEDSKYPIYGNYSGYYGYRSKKQDGLIDPRLRSLDSSLFEGKKCLDVGCNSGAVTVDIAQLLRPSYILGIDIDQKLIKKARNHCSARFSIQKPDFAVPSISLGLSNTNEIQEELEHFPSCVSYMYGFVPQIQRPVPNRPLKDEEIAEPKFPTNIVFRDADIMAPTFRSNFLLNQEWNGYFDVVLALSITKWIHLHHGDAGIKEFFHTCYRLLKPDGSLILEPQSWNSYSKKIGWSPKFVKNYKTIQLKPEQFVGYLLKDVKFSSFETKEPVGNGEKGLSDSLFRL
ncbi:Bicoid-interacting protein 3-domain-containing protein [Paraphysoderma sedebokerense]|nr:Bicoid-interacting protein 3-domain-containing protein [Paraphysoderma sedebokerense]